MIQSHDHETIAERLRDTAGVKAALKKAAREAVNEHARAGQRIVVWRDGQVVWQDAREIAAEEDTDH
tara:strand:- start:13430 stop:13630 length:201 start_codon:yes stop_codon:yes gene_type:complete